MRRWSGFRPAPEWNYYLNFCRPGLDPGPNLSMRRLFLFIYRSRIKSGATENEGIKQNGMIRINVGCIRAKIENMLNPAAAPSIARVENKRSGK